MKKSSAGFTVLYFAIIIFVLSVIGIYFFGRIRYVKLTCPFGTVADNECGWRWAPPPPKACTQEAKICPDGSSVGKTGPNCEFSPCPTAAPTNTQDETANWKTYNDPNNGFSFKYPSKDEITTQKLNSMLSSDSSDGISVAPAYQPPYNQWYTFDAVVRANPQNLDSKTIVNNYVEDVKKNCSPPSCRTPKLISDTLKSYKNREIEGYIFHIGAETDSSMVVYVKNSKTYIFRMSGDQGNVTGYGLDIFDQILSTFKFN